MSSFNIKSCVAEVVGSFAIQKQPQYNVSTNISCDPSSSCRTHTLSSGRNHAT